MKKGKIVEIPFSAGIFSDFHTPITQEDLSILAYPKDYSLADGTIIGEHDGCEHYSLGQRKRNIVLDQKEPYFVIGIDYNTNTLFVGEGANHPGLWTKVLRFPKSTVAFDHQYTLDNHCYNISVLSSLMANPQLALLSCDYEYVYLQFDKCIPIAILDTDLKLIADQKQIAVIDHAGVKCVI